MCTLPYPDRFYAAVAFAASPPPAARGVTDETRLLLYALFQQATEGPCVHPKPWGWNVVESAKWTSWKQLGTMPAMEAMHLYVRTLEDENQNWWQLATDDNNPDKVKAIMEAAAAAAAAAVGSEVTVSNGGNCDEGGEEWCNGAPVMVASPLKALHDATPMLNMWSKASTQGKAPLARHEHAAVEVDGKMYVVGGTSRGKILGDVQVLDLRSLTWSRLESEGGGSDGPPPCSTSQSGGPTSDAPLAATSHIPHCTGHALLAYEGRLLAVGGHLKPEEGGKKKKDAATQQKLEVHAMDLRGSGWLKLQPTGTAPVSRGGHSATLLGDTLWVFGGETDDRRLLNDVHTLNLKTMVWSTPKLSGEIPEVRCKHSAVAISDRYLLVFGGGTAAHCRSGLHMLDTQTLAWSVPPCEGALPAARSGHASASMGGYWYLSGGGDNTHAFTDTLVLKLNAPEEGPLRWLAAVEASEGALSSLASEGQTLVAIHTEGILVAFGGYNNNYHNSTHLMKPMFGSLPASTSTSAIPQQAPPPQQNEEAALELQLMRRQLAGALSSRAAAEKEAEELRELLGAEQTKVMQLQAQHAEMTKKLEHMAMLEQEMASIKAKEAKHLEEAKKGSGGVWGYIAGTPK